MSREPDAVARNPDAVVVLLGDHGPRFDGQLRRGELLDDPEPFSVLHAQRLPDECAGPPDGTSNVNALRVVTACLRGVEPRLLPDEQVAVREDVGG